MSRCLIVILVTIVATITTTLAISDTAKHILDQVNKARVANATNLWKINLMDEDITANVTRVVNGFRNATQNFQQNKCLELTDEDMGKGVGYENSGCYESLALDTMSLIRKYREEFWIVVSESAFIGSAFGSTGIVAYQFQLGPMFLGVFQQQGYGSNNQLTKTPIIN
ncbi:uncharacterized protein LOC128959424 [Oppia nitens]|uniref:uncharacterized protein LOC128959424 n=1 Tax=Oppia nitens TaxID=1686743 RepID=UPI0023DC7137|nr:uncharacterized protein LOC128959424 [Oppia nitens]